MNPFACVLCQQNSGSIPPSGAVPKHYAELAAAVSECRVTMGAMATFPSCFWGPPPAFLPHDTHCTLT